MKLGNDLVVFMCPPYPEYKEPPEDQTHSELFDCPKCKEKMWLSEKRKAALLFSSFIYKEIYFGCYNCIKKLANENVKIFKELHRIDL